MIAGNLNTTNLLLGIMAAVSVLQALVLIGAALMAYRLYRHAIQTVRDIEQRRIAPLTARVDAMMVKVDGIIGDIKDVTARVAGQTERVDAAIQETVQRVDKTAEHVRASIASRINRVMGLAHGLKCAVETFFNRRRRITETPAA